MSQAAAYTPGDGSAASIAAAAVAGGASTGTVAAVTRQQQRLEELCAATIRALTGDAALVFRGHRLHSGERRLAFGAPHLRCDPAQDDFASQRGAADGMALRLLHSDPALHRAMAPEGALARLAFELLEQYRVESLAVLPGLRANLRQRHEAWSQAFHDSRLTESNTGLLLFTLAQVGRSRLTGDPVPEDWEDLMEAIRFQLVSRLGAAWQGLRRARADQVSFAPQARQVAEAIAAMAAADAEGDEALPAGSEAAPEPLPFALWLEPEGDEAGSAALAPSGRSAVLEAAGGQYRAFTTAHDREDTITALGRPELLRSLRAQLDARIAAQGVNLPRLARELRALLADPVESGWDAAQEEGRIDGRSLARLIASPPERRLFRRERIEPQADAIVGVLVDCSGSMKTHAEGLAMVIDVWLRALEQAGVGSELLGFTTSAWNGGRARRDWQRAGRPPHPGRLNEALHLVFKDAHTPWRRARPAVAALLKADLFREGIDGEAVDWACERLLAQPARRRVLMVVSDGCPMDAATQLVNDEHYLDQHLREVVARREAAGEVEVLGVGVGLDLSPWYRRSQVIDLGVAGASVGNQVFRELLGLVARGGPRR